MGAAFSSADAVATDLLLPNAPKIFTVVMLGLEGAGCTSLLSRLLVPTDEQPELPPTSPTLALDRVDVSYGSHRIHFWNPSGHERMRNLWPLSFPHAHAFLFIVDATSTAPASSLDKAKETLHGLCTSPKTWTCADPDFPLFVLVNKIDVAGTPSLKDVAAAMDIEGLTKLRCGGEVPLLATSALTGAGLKSVLDSLVARVSHYHIATHNARIEE
ncbi:ADP-ribosylation factor family-domain-containing protein [Mycena indigotica]|uniref:ADP-ribosylation factor family-domain-containing protein n=1 Tax=Mycena indigotica TaxID=2126181 RepID=A0A8H6T3J5_9AGAR|nr:ADP-ribosylation factor family-domain-containing protein [Mycena indigotica]KAF7309237.1 ADP-ribosylation factor family-domain-containing protein [Mycena indigotica]